MLTVSAPTIAVDESSEGSVACTIERGDGDWFIAVAALLVPLAAVVALDPAGWFPFSTAKWVAVSTAGVAAAAMAMLSARARRVERVEWLLVGTVTGLIAWTVASTVSAVGGGALVGTPVRHLGLVAWILFALMMLVGLAIGGSDEATTRFVGGLVVVGLLLGVYVLVELAIGPPVEWATTSSRLGGPFGSAAYLGAATSLLAPVAFAISIDRRRGAVERAVAATATASLSVALVGSGSRAACVGVAMATVVTMVVVTVTSIGNGSRGHRRGARTTSNGTRSGRSAALPVAGISVVVVAALVAATRGGVFERTSGFSSRLDEWRVALRAIAARPLLGAGPDGYRLVVGRVLDAGYVRRYGEAVATDRAHSGVLDVAAASGVPAAVLYVAVFCIVARSAVRVIRRARPGEVGLAAGVIAYGVQQQFLFPIAEIDPTFWLAAGIVVARAAALGTASPTSVAAASGTPRNPDTANADTAPSVGGERATRCAVTPLVRGSLAALFVVGGVVAAGSGVRQIAADRSAHVAVSTDDPDRSAAAAQHAFDLSPGDVRFRILLARADELQGTVTGIDTAIALLAPSDTGLVSDPGRQFEWARLVSVRSDVTGTAADREAARSAWDDVLGLRPLCIECLHSAAIVALQDGDVERTRSLLARAAVLGDDRSARALDRLDQN